MFHKNNKRRAVAVNVLSSTFIILGLTTLHGVEVITKLYFISAAFEESMTLNLTQRSFKVIHFGGNRKPVYDFI